MNGSSRNTNGNDQGQSGAPDSGDGAQPLSRTHIVCIVDRSGSMQPIAGDAIGGYNSFLESQRKLPGAAVVTLVLFDHEYERLCTALPIAQAPRLDHRSYVPRGTTALLDAIGRTIEDVQKEMTRKEAVDEKVIVAILTDGMENASTDYTFERIAERIAEMQQEHGWEFVYLGANQDAISVASKMSIPAASSASFDATGSGVRH
ncbi:MAG: hypothetical protein IH600_12900, partial [Bacteroidetes bacterium]|nr:hypothetical protein [Bacteroidota bacterium]